jgi:hypothetical protein
MSKPSTTILAPVLTSHARGQCTLDMMTPEALWAGCTSVLLQRINFHQRDASSVVLATHNRAPEMSPATGSTASPEGSPLALNRTEGLPPTVTT